MKCNKIWSVFIHILLSSSSIEVFCSENQGYFSRFKSAPQRALQQVGSYSSSAGAYLYQQVASLANKLSEHYKLVLLGVLAAGLGYKFYKKQQQHINIKKELPNLDPTGDDPIDQLNTKPKNRNELRQQVNKIINNSKEAFEKIAQRDQSSDIYQQWWLIKMQEPIGPPIIFQHGISHRKETIILKDWALLADAILSSVDKPARYIAHRRDLIKLFNKLHKLTDKILIYQKKAETINNFTEVSRILTKLNKLKTIKKQYLAQSGITEK
jgi:hypothetical protein